jgi:hypothetical protein
MNMVWIFTAIINTYHVMRWKYVAVLLVAQVLAIGLFHKTLNSTPVVSTSEKWISPQPTTTISASTTTTNAELHVVILTKDRPHSLHRLLRSLGTPPKTLVDIHHDEHNKGLRSAWLNAWRHPKAPLGIIIEDDIELSPMWHPWLMGAWKVYIGRSDLAGISLQRQSLVPKVPHHDKTIINGNAPFLYRLVGSIGFSPHPDRWKEFMVWCDTHDLATFDPYVPGLITSDWYRVLKKGSMWTQLFIRFCHERNLYTLYITPPNEQTMASHWREKGEHHAGGQGRDYEPAPAIDLVFPTNPTKYGWDGNKESRSIDHVVFTTFRCGECTPLRRMIENNTRTFWSTLVPKNVAFINMDSHHLPRNKYGVPTLKGMYLIAIESYPDALTYTYVNGDIIVDADFFQTIDYVTHHTKKPFLLIGMRYNIKWTVDMSVPINMSRLVQGNVRREYNAEDFFVVSRGAIDWKNLLPVVIGRPAYDNWLVDQVYHNPWITLIDGTQTMTPIHQMDELGSGSWGGKAAHSRTADLNYNIRLCKRRWDHGTVLNAELKTTWMDQPTRMELFETRPTVHIINFFNNGYLDLTKNWVCNMRQFPSVLRRIMFIATDKAGYDGLRSFDDTLQIDFIPFGGSGKLSYGKVEYYRYMQFRTNFILTRLRARNNIWLVEADAVWFKDPSTDVLGSKSDLTLMNDSPPPHRLIQGGFQFIRSTPRTIELWERTKDRLDQTLRKHKSGQDIGDAGSEQLMMNTLLSKIDGLTITWLDPQRFKSGYAYAKRTHEESIILNNWIVGVDNKIKRAKKYGDWFLDNNNRCPINVDNRCYNDYKRTIKHHIDFVPGKSIMMDKESIQWMCKHLKKTFSVLEWGSGGSTLFFSKYVRDWTSIEHDEAWAKKMMRYSPPNVQIHTVPVKWTSLADGDYIAFKEYVEYPKLFNRSYDLVIVDGRARVACAESAIYNNLARHYVLFHDWERSYYKEALKWYTQVTVADKGHRELAVLIKQ